MSETDKCKEINVDKTFDGNDATKYTSYEEYIERLRREQAINQAKLALQTGQPVGLGYNLTASNYYG